jgi:hypothetical protein
MQRIFMRKKTLFRVPAFLLVWAMVAFLVPSGVFAASVSPLSVQLTRTGATSPSSHDIRFIATNALNSGESITLAYNVSGSVSSFSVGSVVIGDLDLSEALPSGGSCAGVTFPTSGTGWHQLVASGASGSQFNATGLGTANIVFTGATTPAITAGNCVRILVNNNHITNGSAGNTIVSITLSNGTTDTGQAGVLIMSSGADQVSVTALVVPAIAFSLSTNAIDFGTITSGTGRWATASGGAAATGTGLSSTAHTMTVGTNAAGGYIVSYGGANLTATGPVCIPATCSATTTITGDNDGDPTTAQFAASYSTNGSGDIESGYENDTNPTGGHLSDWKWVPTVTSPTNTILTQTAPVASEIISASYLANVAVVTPPGVYTTTITYIATGAY